MVYSASDLNSPNVLSTVGQIWRALFLANCFSGFQFEVCSAGEPLDSDFGAGSFRPLKVLAPSGFLSYVAYFVVDSRLALKFS